MTSTSNSNTMISRSKLLDISDLNTYFTSSLFLLFGTLDGGEDSISKYLSDVYQQIIGRNVIVSSNTVQFIFDFATTIYLGINSTNNHNDDDAAASGSGSIVLSPAAHLLGFGYQQTSSSSTSTSSNVISSIQQQQQQRNRRRRRRSRKLQIIVYAFFRIVVPKLYEIMKRKGIEYYVNKKEEEEEEKDMLSPLSPLPSSSPLTLQLSHTHQQQEEKKVIVRTKLKLKLQQISLNRKKLIVQRIIQFIDTTIPIIRLSLLLSCWNTNTKQNTTANQYGGNLSMFLSGLSYTATATSANSMSPLPIASYSLFVLYAHRRWFHREFVDLVWNRIGRSLITASSEMNEMIVPFYQKQKQYLLFLYKQKILSRYYKNKNKDRIIKATKANINNNNYDDENEDENDDNNSGQQHHDCCQLCNTTNVIIPYRCIDCCQQIVCYTCLWNYVIEYNTNSNNNNNHNNSSNNNNSHNSNNNNITKITIPCPICYQDIQHCQPV